MEEILIEVTLEKKIDKILVSTLQTWRGSH